MKIKSEKNDEIHWKLKINSHFLKIEIPNSE
jgi:hypothetical protein